MNKMKILFASRYVDPAPIGSNKNVYLQACGLAEKPGIDVSILTWPDRDHWGGTMPLGLLPEVPLLCRRGGIDYHLFTAPESWNEMAGGDSLGEREWEDAVAYGMGLLLKLKPDIFHLQHRHGFWWLLDSAQRLGIKTVYSNHDWGIGCIRTILLTGAHEICDGIVEPKKCTQCVKVGRGLVGKVIEKLVEFKNFEKRLASFEGTSLGDSLKKRGLVRQPAALRVNRNYERAKRVLSKLDCCFTPSLFGKEFFCQFGLPKNSVSVLPWYFNESLSVPTDKSNQPFTMTYIGRISPEKGVLQIFEALETITDHYPVTLRIAGAVDTAFARKIQHKYPSTINGIHTIEWLGWCDTSPLYGSTDVSIIPSQHLDNTPLTLIDSLAHSVPVIATRIPTIEELVQEGETGYLFDFNSIHSLADAIQHAYVNKANIRRRIAKFPKMLSLEDYLSCLVAKYRSLLSDDKIV